MPTTPIPLCTPPAASRPPNNLTFARCTGLPMIRSSSLVSVVRGVLMHTPLFFGNERSLEKAGRQHVWAGTVVVRGCPADDLSTSVCARGRGWRQKKNKTGRVDVRVQKYIYLARGGWLWQVDQYRVSISLISSEAGRNT